MPRPTSLVIVMLLPTAVLTAPGPAHADILRQTGNGAVITRTPGGEVKGYGYRGQLVSISNCYPVGAQGGTVADNALLGLHVNLSTGIQGYTNDYYLGGRC